MSAIRAINPINSRSAQGFAPRLVSSARAQFASRKLSAAMIIGLGLVGIQLLSLFIGAFISQGAYQLAQLKQERRDLATTSDILAAQVDSLSSMQNLSNAAHGLGMVANTNPVFLRLSDQKVIGKPKAAYAVDGHVSSNMVPNAMLTSRTDVVAIKARAALAHELALATAAAKAAAAKSAAARTSVNPVNSNVVKPVSFKAPVSSSSDLPVSPTH
jgi:hypothetical protein